MSRASDVAPRQVGWLWLQVTLALALRKQTRWPLHGGACSGLSRSEKNGVLGTTRTRPGMTVHPPPLPKPPRPLGDVMVGRPAWDGPHRETPEPGLCTGRSRDGPGLGGPLSTEDTEPSWGRASPGSLCVLPFLQLGFGVLAQRDQVDSGLGPKTLPTGGSPWLVATRSPGRCG